MKLFRIFCFLVFLIFVFKAYQNINSGKPIREQWKQEHYDSLSPEKQRRIDEYNRTHGPKPGW